MRGKPRLDLGGTVYSWDQDCLNAGTLQVNGTDYPSECGLGLIHDVSEAKDIRLDIEMTLKEDDVAKVQEFSAVGAPKVACIYWPFDEVAGNIEQSTTGCQILNYQQGAPKNGEAQISATLVWDDLTTDAVGV